MAERPLECSECKRPAKVHYKEITHKGMTCTEMCEECPVLKAKLHGDTPPTPGKNSTLCCGVCGTTLDSVLMGQPLGCPECYTVFANTIIQELCDSSAIPLQLKKKAAAQKLQTLHIGRSLKSPALSSQLSSLNEALSDAIKRENYEQAATIRDQIKSLIEKNE